MNLWETTVLELVAASLGALSEQNSLAPMQLYVSDNLVVACKMLGLEVLGSKVESQI